MPVGVTAAECAMSSQKAAEICNVVLSRMQQNNFQGWLVHGSRRDRQAEE